MNDKRLRIYLDDHLALMVGESELAARCRASNRRTPLGQFLHRLEGELKAQKSVVRDMLHRIGAKEGVESTVKQSAAWVAEKLGRCKLNDSLLGYSKLSRVLELEALAAAAQARTALWDNLDAVARKDSRLDDIRFSFLCEQSEGHLDELNTRRRFAAAEAFVGR